MVREVEFLFLVLSWTKFYGPRLMAARFLRVLAVLEIQR